jgi:hypothetical protein
MKIDVCYPSKALFCGGRVIRNALDPPRRRSKDEVAKSVRCGQTIRYV